MADITKVLGMADLSAAFKDVRTEMETRVARRMVVAGGKIIRDRAKANAQANDSVISGAMRDNIAIKREARAPDGTAQYHIGVRHGSNQTRKVRGQGSKRLVVSRGRIVTRRENDPFYWKFVERGHRVIPASVVDGSTTYVQRLRNGKLVTRQRAFSGRSLRARRRLAGLGVVGKKPFIEPALEQERRNALEAMEKTLQRYLNSERRKGRL